MDRARVSRRGARRWAQGHPWIYRSDVLERPAGPAGAVRVLNEGGGFLGLALWSPASEISLRLLGREEVAVDGGWLRERLAAAAAYRRALAGELPAATAERLVHGEADGLPSLVVDRYGPYLVVQLLSAGLEAYRGELVDALREVFEPAGILARNDVRVRLHEALPIGVELLAGSVPEEVEVEEAGVRYLASPWQGQKTGAFLDQRENRARAGALAGGRALDCFSYHGSFALQLARGGAEVVAVDSSAEALRRAEANAALNGTPRLRVQEANAFDFLRAEEAAGARYATIVVDPPAFAKRRDAVERAFRGYKELNLRAMRLLEPGGHLLTFSCSYHLRPELFRRMIEEAAADAGRPLRWVESRHASRDHPEIVQIPETVYLKGAVLQAL
jgi:23S rRNA (cytosine1962-C5)-methyltransferase